MAPIRIKQSPASSAQTLASSHDPRLLVRETICISANLASAPSSSSSSSIAIENSGLWPELRLGLVEEQFLYSSLRVICCEEIDGRRWKYVAQKDSLGRFKKGSIRAVSLQTPQPPGKTKSGRPYVLFPPAARRMDTLDDLLATNNLISLHYALSNETAQNINADCLQHIKPEAFLVNTGSLLQIRK